MFQLGFRLTTERLRSKAIHHFDFYNQRDLEGWMVSYTVNNIWYYTASRFGLTSQMQLWSTFFPFEMYQSCRFEQFASGPKLQFEMWSKIHVSNWNFRLLPNCLNLQFYSLSVYDHVINWNRVLIFRANNR